MPEERFGEIGMIACICAARLSRPAVIVQRSKFPMQITLLLGKPPRISSIIMRNIAGSLRNILLE